MRPGKTNLEEPSRQEVLQRLLVQNRGAKDTIKPQAHKACE